MNVLRTLRAFVRRDVQMSELFERALAVSL